MSVVVEAGGSNLVCVAIGTDPFCHSVSPSSSLLPRRRRVAPSASADQQLWPSQHPTASQNLVLRCIPASLHPGGTCNVCTHVALVAAGRGCSSSRITWVWCSRELLKQSSRLDLGGVRTWIEEGKDGWGMGGDRVECARMVWMTRGWKGLCDRNNIVPTRSNGSDDIRGGGCVRVICWMNRIVSLDDKIQHEC
jgi:hypothetical protein